ncbi:type II toxin-antitoxin system RelE/ParE family toxin [Bradyrhizobium sp. LTSPM299]|uniref:type II toxin-antitoxin system RelE/ParE family toxin n=1 Tax=Bradyrhizobium sp. LTSPM299 TaxID=1619233 RepID=UPI0009E3D0AA|nr:type II toxin-antitoxin system RelE/ParE family toxin [Bradyrhizobium sp. LTSPM299]
MNVRYTRRALAQIDQALSYIAARSPQGAVHVRDRVLALVTLLQERPYAGRATSRPGVRQLPATPYPYLIDYRVMPTEIIIMRFRCAAWRPIG